MNFPVKPGQPHPLGATVDDHGVNFAVFSQHANSVTLLVFEAHDSLEPVQEVPLSRTFHFWHAHLEGLGAGAHYAFRVDGPWDPDEGHRSIATEFSLIRIPRATTTPFGTAGMRATRCPARTSGPWTTSPTRCAAR